MHKTVRAFIYLILLWVFIALPSLSAGDSVDYLYDDNGRLVKASKTDNTRILYQYDEVGNLIGTYKETSASQSLPPVLQGIDPDILLIDETYNIVISGQNLLTTSSVTSDNPDITIKFIAAIDSKIIAVLSIADTASPGQANITVTTSYGSASIPVNLYGVNITPKAVLSFPSRTISFSAALIPSATSDLTVKVNNENPDIIDIALTITIPAGGAINFDVTTLRPGAGAIKIGNGQAIVEVIGDFYKTQPVSVAIETPSTSEASVSSNSVSVAIDINPSDITTSESAPVSVTINNISSDIATFESMPVSVNIGGSFDTATSESAPVSVTIESISSDIATVESMPVSVIIDISLSDSVAAESLPVSVVISADFSVSATVNPLPVSVIIQAPQLADATTVSQPVSVGWCTNEPVKVSGGTTTYYSSLQDAYDAALNGDTIQSQFGEFAGDVTMDNISDKSVTLEGGYNCDYSAVIGATGIKGKMTINRGTVTIRNFILKK